MLSLFGWGSGSGDGQHLADKEPLKEEKRLRLQSTTAMTSGTVKRKRGKSTQSVQRPPKKSSKPSKDVTAQVEEDVSNRTGENDHSDLVPSENQNESMEWNKVIAGADSHATHNEEGSPDRLDRLRSVISRQFNLEILLKHNELRLIDQEIAKVQIALEQLRRCSVVPYPAMTMETNDMLNVAHARGLAASTEPGMIPATQPPPWGVVDGPYSRHYAKWLLPDPIFDGTHPEALRQAAKVGKTSPERHTRGGKELSLPMTKPRQRAGLARYQTVGSANGDQKEAKGPMILKRALDGKLVKLVCTNCHREDFNSAQGFINHCRIAHSHNLASHEVAARECGQEIDPADVVITAPDSTIPVPVQQPAAVIGFVHPLNKTQIPVVPRLSIPIPRRNNRPAPANRELPASTASEIASSFKPSNQVPHLSRLFERLGKGIDLTAAVEDATIRDESMELDGVGEDISDAESDDLTGGTTPTAQSMARVPSRMSVSANSTGHRNGNQSKSRKGPERAMRRPYSGHTSQQKSTQITLPDRRDNHDLSPHTTASVNNAPSLVSDSDNDSPEDDEEYTADHEAAPSPEGDSSEAEDEDIDVDMEHDHHLSNGYGNDHASSSAADPELRVSSKAKRHHVSSRSDHDGSKLQSDAEPRTTRTVKTRNARRT